MNAAPAASIVPDVSDQPSGAPGENVLSVNGLDVVARTDAGDTPLVEALTFDLRRGETLCIAGESGSGKSITSLAIMGLLPQPAVRISGGSILFGGRDLATLDEAAMRRIRGDRIAMIFQEPMTSLNPVLSIGRQLIEAIEAHTSLPRGAARERAIEALDAVRIPQARTRLKQYPHELSGGMRQRVMIAMALALRPDVLIADEPTTALDVTVQGEVLELLRDLKNDFGTSIILITHDMGVVAEMADRVIVMQKGRMIESGAVGPLFAAPSQDYTRSLLDAVPRLGDGMASGTAQLAGGAGNVVDVEGLTVGFDIRGGIFGRATHRVHAVENVSFTIRDRETFSLVGESGCGKSTIAKALAGLVPFTGDIRLGGTSIAGLDRHGLKRVRRDIQMIFQDPFASLDPRMRVGDLVGEPLIIHGIATPSERRERVAALFDRVGLSPDQMERYPHEFSGGQRQRICIARALALRPKLIIADESVSALDVSVQARVLELLKELQAEFGIAYLFISHDMAVVENISDRVAVMYLGQIVEMGTRDQVFSNPQHAYTRRLIDAVPIPDPAKRRARFPRMQGEVPSPVHARGRSPTTVTLRDIGGGHLVAGN
ncbi:MAG: ABC transporter ATP-binding protein [Alphaproteobacteria bacterium]|nr:ABC transporter ATP-binding protein [Alphaproteobacteria bacterium]MBU0804284.1 ABC transporter ATP-binding protein [Alphaproteobacteria bacterium]MBU0871115.1 ABC transporter ATP-binding protein [Alphaproteobacteria bacterium]MBU1400870.1 ABC transporter ATP-binding protein [Alphaproteobacteria bacterium]MBU1592713.1 ABC transporter ATP-binding protein [Alphaproteobacteria bacterium]